MRNIIINTSDPELSLIILNDLDRLNFKCHFVEMSESIHNLNKRSDSLLNLNKIRSFEFIKNLLSNEEGVIYGKSIVDELIPFVMNTLDNLVTDPSLTLTELLQLIPEIANKENLFNSHHIFIKFSPKESRFNSNKDKVKSTTIEEFLENQNRVYQLYKKFIPKHELVELTDSYEGVSHSDSMLCVIKSINKLRST